MSTSTKLEKKNVSFPLKLHTMLDDSSRQGLQGIVAWEMDGTAFKVHNTDEFVRQVMPQYFNQTKYKSFQRQLNLYGFTRITKGPDKGCYLHDLFTRDSIDGCKTISRKKSTDENDFFDLDLAPTWLPAAMAVEPDPIREGGRQSQQPHQSVQSQTQQQSSFFSSSVASLPPPPPVQSMDAFEAFFQNNVIGQSQQDQQEQNGGKQKGGNKSFFQRANIPTAAGTVSGDIRPPSNTGNALKRMLDSFLEPGESSKNQGMNAANTTQDDDAGTGAVGTGKAKKYQRTAVFPDKLHDMLAYAESNKLTHIISWEMDGRAFRVHDSSLFMTHVMPQFFKQTKYESLQRQLNLYGFTRIPRGRLKGCYYHPAFLKGGRALSQGMTRRKPEDAIPQSASSISPSSPSPLPSSPAKESAPSRSPSSKGDINGCNIKQPPQDAKPSACANKSVQEIPAFAASAGITEQTAPSGTMDTGTGTDQKSEGMDLLSFQDILEPTPIQAQPSGLGSGAPRLPLAAQEFVLSLDWANGKNNSSGNSSSNHLILNDSSHGRRNESFPNNTFSQFGVVPSSMPSQIGGQNVEVGGMFPIPDIQGSNPTTWPFGFSPSM